MLGLVLLSLLVCTVGELLVDTSGTRNTFNVVDVRPAPSNRTFNSSLVNHIIKKLQTTGDHGSHNNIQMLLQNCLPNTLDTTVFHSSVANNTHGEIWDTFIITGDITAMWLRDSMNQVFPYVRLFNASCLAGKRDRDLERFLLGVVHRQAGSILIDKYANAYAWMGPGGQTGVHTNDRCDHNACKDLRIYERKFEIDSLMSFLKLAISLHEVSDGSAAHVFLEDKVFVPAVRDVLGVLEQMQNCSYNNYTFQRKAFEPTDTLSHGIGFPCQDTGMVRTHFRPSDDAVKYAFNIPGNAMTAVELGRLPSLLRDMNNIYEQEPMMYPWATDLLDIEKRAKKLEDEIRVGIEKHGTMNLQGQTIFAYEVDGRGNAVFMDDANIPSLLSLPFLGFVAGSNPLYQRTRRMILSTQNPYYFKGALGIGGVGGPHVGAGHVWPMALMMQAWTSDNLTEVSELISQLVESSQPNSLMHESFDQNTFKTFTRSWFAWANTLFGSLLLKVASDPVLWPAAKLSSSGPINLVELLDDWAPPCVV